MGVVIPIEEIIKRSKKPIAGLRMCKHCEYFSCPLEQEPCKTCAKDYRRTGIKSQYASNVTCGDLIRLMDDNCLSVILSCKCPPENELSCFCQLSDPGACQRCWLKYLQEIVK